MSESMVQIRSVTKVYERGKQKVEVLHGLSLEIPKGDFVAWAQQLLAGAGMPVPITGYYQASTQSAVYSFQATRGLPQTGNLDVPTWSVLIQSKAVPVTWTKSGALASSSGGRLTLPAPPSAKLPSVRNEIPPPAKRAR